MRENFVYNEHTDNIFASSSKERDYIMRMASKWMAATLAGLLTVVSIPINALQQTQAADFSVWINEICTQNKSCLQTVMAYIPTGSNFIIPAILLSTYRVMAYRMTQPNRYSLHFRKEW